MHINSMF